MYVCSTHTTHILCCTHVKMNSKNSDSSTCVYSNSPIQCGKNISSDYGDGILKWDFLLLFSFLPFFFSTIESNALGIL